jgi:hypothetical protein
MSCSVSKVCLLSRIPSSSFIRLELRDDWRLENRQAFANVWSDMVYGVVLFLLICFNQSKVSIDQKTVSFSFPAAYQNLCSSSTLHMHG